MRRDYLPPPRPAWESELPRSLRGDLVTLAEHLDRSHWSGVVLTLRVALLDPDSPPLRFANSRMSADLHYLLDWVDFPGNCRRFNALLWETLHRHPDLQGLRKQEPIVNALDTSFDSIFGAYDEFRAVLSERFLRPCPDYKLVSYGHWYNVASRVLEPGPRPLGL